MVVMEKDKDMSRFFEMSWREAEDDNLPALMSSDEHDESRPGFSLTVKMEPSLHAPLMGADDFLNLENHTTNYDWLLTPPDIPLFPLLEMESKRHICSQPEATTIQPTALNTKPADTQDPKSGLEASPPDLNVTKGGNKIQSASKNPKSVKSKSAAANPSRSSTPSSRTSMPSSIKPKNPSTRSSTPGRSGSHLSSPAGSGTASSQVVSKSAPRSSAPICKKPCLTVRPCVSGPGHSSAVAKSAPSNSNKPAFARNKVPIAKSCIAKPPEALHSHEIPLHSKASLQERPGSTPKGRPEVANHKVASSRESLNKNQAQKSCSLSRERAPNSSGFNGRNFVSAWNHGHSTDTDHVNPVVIGSQMVERVVNMRKLAPPKPDCHSGQNKSSEKSSSSREHSGFGLSLSKKSLDMAIRHMSITGSVSDTLKPLNMKIGASSGHSTPTGSTKSSTNLSGSPFATSSDASSDPMVHFS